MNATIPLSPLPVPAGNDPGQPRRILLVFEPGVDGVFRYVEGLARQLVERPGVALQMAYSSTRGSRGLEELVEFLHTRGVPTLDLRVNNMPAPGDIRAVAQLLRFVRAEKPDVIHGHSSKAGVLVRTLALFGVKARFLYTPHAYYQMYGKPSGRRRIFQGIERAFARIGTTINVSASEGDYARTTLGLPPGRQVVLISGIDCERFQPAADPAVKNAARAHFGLPADAPLLGTVARYSEQKDPLMLYRAVLAVLAERPALHFAHLGRGELSAQVDDLIGAAPAGVQARIHRREASDVPAEFYRALDAFVLPSRYEGFALAALEAVASGLPLILSDCPGNNDLKDYTLDEIYWVQPEDTAGLQGTLLEWADTPRRTNNHRQIALESFDSAKTCEQLIAIYLGRK